MLALTPSSWLFYLLDLAVQDDPKIRDLVSQHMLSRPSSENRDQYELVNLEQIHNPLLLTNGDLNDLEAGGLDNESMLRL